MYKVVRNLAVFSLLGLISLAAAHEYSVGTLLIRHPWARATSAGMENGAVYLEVVNSGKQADRLESVSGDLATRIELHTNLNDGGMMKMRRVDGVDLPAGQTVSLKPGGFHIMLFGLKQPLKEGEKLPLTLEFSKAGKLKVEVQVESMTTVDIRPHP